MKRTREWTRYQRKRAIDRKSGILTEVYGRDEVRYWTGGKPGKLSKGKIHCSCRMCRKKSYDEPGAADMRKNISAKQEMEDETE